MGGQEFVLTRTVIPLRSGAAAAAVTDPITLNNLNYDHSVFVCLWHI